MALVNFLNKYRLEKGSKAVITHTSMVSGSYSIPDDELPKVLDVVYKQCVLAGREEHLVERQRDGGAIIIDLDFRYSIDCKKRMHNKAWIDDLLDIYLTNIKKIANVTDEPFKMFVMEKDYVPEVKDELTKDGIHIIITINSPHTVQEKLRELVMADSAELMARLPLQNSIDDVFDYALSSGQNGIVLFGCRKPEGRPYNLTYAYECNYDLADGEPCRKNYPTTMTKETFMELCIRNTDNRTQFQFKPLALETLQNTYTNNTQVIEYATDVNLTDCTTEIQKLLAIIGSSRCGSGQYKVWFAVAQAIKNETKDTGLADFVGWTIAYGTPKKKMNAINKYQNQIKYTPKNDKNRLSIASLHWWAKNDNPAAYRLAFQTTTNVDVVIEPEMAETFKIIESAVELRTEYSTAVAFNKLYPGLQKCVDKQRKEYYCFIDKTKLWEFDVGGTPIRNRLSTEFYDAFAKYKLVKEAERDTFEPNSPQHETNKKQLKTITDMMRDLQNTNNKNNILTEIGDICKDVIFPSTLNKSEYLIPTNDGKVLDMQTLKLQDRTIAHNFSYQCNAKLIPYDKDDANFILADKYFDDLFRSNNDTKMCVINILKSVFIGRPLRYIYFCVGSGSNGKSLLFKIINKIFGNFMDVISESVIIEPKGAKSALNTEIEKLDKCRLGYITELKETDKLNEKVIKQISGGDAINLRTLHTKDYTINPTCNLFVLTNEFPTFNGEATPMLNRMITIPFKNTFAVKDEFEREMLAISDYVFSYIMHTGTVCDKFQLSTEMIEEKEKHARNNTETTLADYLKVRLVDCENDKTNKLLLVNDIRMEFERYCEKYKLKNTVSARKFPGKLRDLGYDVRESNSKIRLYGKKFIEVVADDDGTDGDYEEV